MEENKKLKIGQLEKKLRFYETKLAKRSLAYGDVVRTRYGDSYEDQIRDDTNVLKGLIESIKLELESLKK